MRQVARQGHGPMRGFCRAKMVRRRPRTPTELEAGMAAWL